MPAPPAPRRPGRPGMTSINGRYACFSGHPIGSMKDQQMNEVDFSGRRVLVVGGSSGIGNGIAQAFRGHGASVHVWGTRARAEDYSDEQGSDLGGLGYTQVDV